jgi:hypothetical protein
VTSAERPATPLFDLFTTANWAMTYGDRVALEGVLSQVAPRLSVEIGTAQGGSLARIAAHSREVHTIDVVRDPQLELPANAVFHEGESARVLPALLDEFTEAGRNVDFVLVDGDHAPDAVRTDLETLLGSRAVGRAVILLHDSFNPWVRAGIESADPRSHPRVLLSSLDLISGGVWGGGPFDVQLWGGFAIVVVGEPADGSDLDRMQVWLDGPVDVESSMDAWESVRRAEPVIAEARAARPGAKRAQRLRRRVRKALPGTKRA